MISLREMSAAELSRIPEIDRSERIVERYASRGGELSVVEVDIDAPRWGEYGEHPVQHYVDLWSGMLERGGTVIGAFDGDRLVGIVVYDRSFATEPSLLASVFVSRTHRGRGIGRALVNEVVHLARSDGAPRLYVSSIPTRGTVDFYLSCGFELLEAPNEELFELEPEDVHLAMTL